MVTFAHILVPTDFGEPADHALDTAIALAKKFDSKITLFHSTWFPPTAYMAYAEGFVWPFEEVSKAAKRELDARVAEAVARYPRVEGVVDTGEPWRVILATVNALGVDLVVMGTHGRHGLSRVLLGSVAEKIVRLAHVPVLTVSSEPDRQAREAAVKAALAASKP